LSVVSLALSVVAGAATLYLWTMFEQSRTNSALIQSALSDRMGRQERSGEQDHLAITEAVRQSQATKAEVDELRSTITRDRNVWLLAEADYLLSIANRKLRFEHDVNAAIAALDEADARLRILNDSLLIRVRSAVARDLQALKRVAPVDRTGIAVQLSALIQVSADLPFAKGIAGAVPQDPEKKRPEITDAGGFFGAVWDDIKGLVTIRRIDKAATPLLPPDQRYFLRQNLALKLNTARFALLQREPAVYQASLAEAQAWIERYFETSAPGVHSGVQTIKRLRGVAIAPTLPDIENTLHTLRQIKRELDLDAQGGAER
jgi:uncharacterized protein HemX